MRPADFGPYAAVFWAARAHVGTRFRLHGRNPATGLDCVGLAAVALHDAGIKIGPVPTGYGLKDHSAEAIIAMLQQAGLMAAPWDSSSNRANIGHIALYHVGARQHHLAIIGPQSAVHAHAGLRRVVESPLPLDGQLIGYFYPFS
jgi:murein DD-endopeptidase / murein LD-carboxypeptidase